MLCEPIPGSNQPARVELPPQTDGDDGLDCQPRAGGLHGRHAATDKPGPILVQGGHTYRGTLSGSSSLEFPPNMAASFALPISVGPVAVWDADTPWTAMSITHDFYSQSGPR